MPGERVRFHFVGDEHLRHAFQMNQIDFGHPSRLLDVSFA